jgi:hypothetical protein
MIPVDPLLLEAFRYSHTRTVYMTVYSGSTRVTEPLLAIKDGSVTANRDQRARRSLSCSIPLSQWEDVPALNVISSRVLIEVGFDLGAQAVVMPVGMFRVNELGRNNAGELSLSGTSLESYVIEDDFERETTYPIGVNCLDKLREVILESLPDANFIIDPAINPAIQLHKPLQSTNNRWDTVEAMAHALNADVYCDPVGNFVVRPRPSMIDAKPVWRINEGPDGVLIGLNTKVSRDQMYNAVQVIAQNAFPGDEPYSGDWQRDTDPNSPTRWGGPFGRKSIRYTDPGIKYFDDMDPLRPPFNGAQIKDQCNKKAQELLLFYLAEERQLNLSAIPNPALEPDDFVQVSMLDHTEEVFLVTSMTIPLGLSEWTAETLSNKTHERLNPDSPLKQPEITA